MKTFVESNISADQIVRIQEAVAKRVPGNDFKAFFIGLLSLSFEDGDRGYSRAEIAAVTDPDRSVTTGNFWAAEKKLDSLIDLHRTFLSQHLDGRLLTLQRQDTTRPYLYRLGISDAHETSNPFFLRGSILRYRADETAPSLSVVGRLLHPGVGRNSSEYRPWLFVTPPLLLIFAMVVVGLFTALLAMVSSVKNLAFLQTYLLCGFLGFVLWWTFKERWGRLYDDNMILLGTPTVKGAHEGILLDRHRDATGRSFVLRHYRADCPICDDDSIVLARGEPEFSARIVGRCKNSPREHVFSFDRITLEGAPLRQTKADA